PSSRAQQPPDKETDISRINPAIVVHVRRAKRRAGGTVGTRDHYRDEPLNIIAVRGAILRYVSGAAICGDKTAGARYGSARTADYALIATGRLDVDATGCRAADIIAVLSPLIVQARRSRRDDAKLAH